MEVKGMKIGDSVEYLGSSDAQVNWGNNDDPRSFLIVGRHYIVEDVEVHRQHTKVKLRSTMGWFNSVSFKVIHTEVNSLFSKELNSMDPSDIVLESTSKMFEFEKHSREVDGCEDMDKLKTLCKCFIKLYLKHQEVTSQMLLSK